MAYNLSQGMGWRWGEHHKPVEAARFNLTIIVFLLVAVTIGLIGIDPLQLALLGSRSPPCCCRSRWPPSW